MSAVPSSATDATKPARRSTSTDTSTDQARAQRAGIDLLPALALTRAPIISADRPNGQATDDDLMYINRQARSPLTADDVYVLPTESSNRTIDSYYTQMSERTLGWFAEDATAGVAFCDSHNHYQLPMGRTFFGQVVDADPASGGKAAYLLTYMLRNLQLANGLNSNDVIRGLDGGVYQDISVGFKPLAYWCNICHCNMLTDWDCMHWPGQTYETEDGGEILCVASVDARLAEHSLVYEGATPNAMTLKAQREMALGRATVRSLAFVEEHCRTLLRGRWPGVSFDSEVQQYLKRAQPQDTQPATRLDDAEGASRAPEALGHAPAIVTPPARSQGASADGPRQGAANDLAASRHAAAPESYPESTGASDAPQEDEMRGSQLIARFITAYEDEATRAGKEISTPNMKALRDMQTQLEAAHAAHGDAADTMDYALHELGKFLDARSDDGDNAPPESTEGAADPTADAAADETGASGDGEDADDAGTPADADPPGTDDGDGDDDKPTRADAAPAAPAADPNPTPAAAAPATRAAAAAVVTTDDTRAMHPAAVPAAGLSEEDRELIETGRAYRADLIEETLKAGVRAFGAPFDPAMQRSLLERATVEELRKYRDHYRSVTAATFSPRGHWVPDESLPAGGRWTDEPTMVGARQTLARDANDPVGIAPALRSGIAARQGTSSDVMGPATLYTMGKGKHKRG